MKNETSILNGICVLFVLIALVVAGATISSGELTVDNLYLTVLCLALAIVFAFNPALELRRSLQAEKATLAAAGEVHAAEGDHTIYYMVWGGLISITLVEIVLAYLQINIKVMLVTLLGLSFVKAGLIMAYFMHLKFERRSLILTVVPITVVLIGLFAIFFPDSLRLFNLAVSR